MVESAARRVGIIHDQCEAAGFERHAFEMDRRNSVFAIHGVLVRDFVSVLKCLTHDFHKGPPLVLLLYHRTDLLLCN